MCRTDAAEQSNAFDPWKNQDAQENMLFVNFYIHCKFFIYNSAFSPHILIPLKLRLVFVGFFFNIKGIFVDYISKG